MSLRMISTSRMIALSVGVATAIALVFTTGRAGPVPFHLALVKSEPKADTTVAAAPAEVKIWFTELVKPAVTGIRVLASDSSAVALESVTAGATTKDPIAARIKTPLKAGKYRVMWKTMGDDSHAVSGEFVFTYRPAETSGLQK